MRAPRLTWGNGPRTAVLVHGYTDDADTWWQIGPALAEHGFQVHAIDLIGHGLGPRPHRYSLDAFLADLVSVVPQGVDLLLGHSLGALLVNHAAQELRPRRVVLVDPPWGPLPPPTDRTPGEADVSDVAAGAPAWSPEDVRVDVVSSRRLDPAVATWIAGDPLEGSMLLVAPHAPTLVVVPADGALVPVGMHDELRTLGFDIVEVPGVGHVVHRDNPPAVVELCAWGSTGDGCAPRPLATT